MRNLRKLLLLTAALTAAMAMSASAASAARFDPNPDFPYDDTDPGSWIAVDTNYAEFDGELDTLTWTQHNYPGYIVDQCWVRFEGSIDESGAVSISDTPTWMSSPLFTGQDLCDYNLPHNLPWSGQVCRHQSTGEAWIRLYADLENYSLEGEVFGRLVNGTTLVLDNTVFNHLASTGGPMAPWIRWDVDLDLASELEVAEDDEQAPCGWPELS
jgi:hypothetical protein